jgi:WD40 repeat protein
LWDLTTREKIKTLGHQQELVSCVRFSPDGRYLAAGSIDRTVRLWEVATGQQFLIGWHDRPVTCVVFSPDGRWLASSGKDPSIRLWNLGDLRKLPVIFRGHNGHIGSLDFTADSQTLISGSVDGTVRLWNVNTHKEDAFLGRRPTTLGLRFSPDGKLTGRLYLLKSERAGANEYDDHFRIRSVASRQVIADLPARDALFSPRGDVVAAITGTNSFTVWDTGEFKIKTNVQCNATLVRPLCFSPDGALLAVIRDSKEIEFFDTGGWRPREIWPVGGGGTSPSEACAYTTHTGSILAFSPDAELLTVSCQDGSVRIYDPGLRREIRQLRPGPKEIDSVDWLRHSRTLVLAGSVDPTVHLWNLDNDQHEVLKPDAGNVWSLAVSPDGKTLAAGTLDGAVVLWNIPSRRQVTILRDHFTVVGRLAFSPDSRVLVSEALDGFRVRHGDGAEE